MIARRLATGFARLITLAGSAALVVATVHVFADVVLTKFFRQPIPGTQQIVTGYYMVALFFLPLAHAELLDAHIATDILFTRFNRSVRRWLAGANYLLLSAFLGYFCWQAGIKAIRQSRIGEMTTVNDLTILLWPSRWLVVIGLVAFLLVALIRLFDIALNGLEERDAPGGDAADG